MSCETLTHGAAGQKQVQTWSLDKFGLSKWITWTEEGNERKKDKAIDLSRGMQKARCDPAAVGSTGFVGNAPSLDTHAEAEKIC